MTETTEPDTAPMTPEYTGEFRTTKPTLASLTLDHLLRATFENARLTQESKDFDKVWKMTIAANATLNAELQDLRDRLAKLDSPEVAELRERAAKADDFEKSCMLARDYGLKLQERIDRYAKDSRNAEVRLSELWLAATLITELRARGVRGKIAENAMGRLRKALEMTSIDCGQIPF